MMFFLKIFLLAFIVHTFLWAFPKTENVPGGIALLKLGHVNEEAPTVTFGEEKAMLIHDGNKGWLALIGVPLDAKSGEKKVDVKFGNKTLVKTFTVNNKKYKEQHITLKSNKRVNLSQEDLDRHYKEKKKMTSALSEYSESVRPDLEFLLPVEGRTSGNFGLRRFYNKQPRNPHKGLDIAANRGTPVKAASDGKVLLTGDLFFNGNTVVIDHGRGLISMYCHLNSIAKKEGEMIKKGEILGTVGSTGRSTGPHLHFGVYMSGTWINPELFIGEQL